MKMQIMMWAGLTALLLFTGAGAASAQTPDATHAVIGTGTPASCQTNQAVNDFTNAVIAGGVVSFNCGPNFVEIEVNTSVVDKTVTVNGGGLVGLNGEDVRQIFLVTGTGNLTLNDMSLLDGGGGGGNGGAISIAANGQVTSNRSYFTSNQVESGSNGGAIYTEGELNINDTWLGSNEAKLTGNGGAIYATAGSTVIIRDSYLVSNQAQNGGAIYKLSGSGAFTLDRTGLRNNIARVNGGGVHLSGNVGLILNSTFSSNTADRGGAIHKSGNIPISFATFNENRADTGGAIYNAGGQTTLSNSIVTGSREENGGSPSLNCDGPAMTSGGRNIIGDGTCVGNSNPEDMQNTDPQLGIYQLAPVHGYIPAATSPAIDRGLNCPAVDQRNFPRPLGPACDVGAIERGSLTYLPLIER